MNSPFSKEQLLNCDLSLNRVIFLAIVRPAIYKKKSLKGYYFGGEGELGWIATPPHLEQIPGVEGKGIHHDEENN